jgi:hypothetical protein
MFVRDLRCPRFGRLCLVASFLGPSAIHRGCTPTKHQPCHAWNLLKTNTFTRNQDSLNRGRVPLGRDAPSGTDPTRHDWRQDRSPFIEFTEFVGLTK